MAVGAVALLLSAGVFLVPACEQATSLEDCLEKTRHGLERWIKLLAKLDGFRASLIETVVPNA